MNKSILSTKIFIIIIINISQAQESLSLKRAIEIGLENNYQIKISKKQTEIAAASNNYEAAGRYPNVSLNISNNNSFNLTENEIDFAQQNGASVANALVPSVDASWVLFDGWKVNINKRRFEELQNQTMGNTEIAIENTIQSIMQAYYLALIQKEQLGVLREVIQLSKDRIAYQEIKKEYGQAGTFDILQTQDAYLNDSTTLLVQTNTLETALRNLNLAMGVDDFSKTYILTDPLPQNPARYQYEVLEEELFNNNKNIKNLYVAQELAKINLDFQESFRYPTVRANAGLRLNGNSFKLFKENPMTQEPFGAFLSGSSNLYLNFSASYPLYDAGNRKRNIEIAKMEQEVSEMNILDIKRNLSAQLNITLANYNNQLRLLNLTDQLIKNSKTNLNLAQERFKGGLITSFDYRTIQLAYVNASQSRLNALYNLKNTEIDILRITGKIRSVMKD